MKIAISLLLMFVMCLSLWACSGGDGTSKITEKATETTGAQLSKEELVFDAISTDVLTLQKASVNRAKAKQDYCNKPIIVHGRVSYVREDHVLLRDEDGQVSVRVYLSTAELVMLERGQQISVVGIISDIQDLEALGFSGKLYATYIMDLAYFLF